MSAPARLQNKNSTSRKIYSAPSNIEKYRINANNINKRNTEKKKQKIQRKQAEREWALDNMIWSKSHSFKSSRKQRSSKKREDNSSMLSPVNGSSSNYITNKSIDSLKQLVNNKEKPLSTPPPYYNLLLRTIQHNNFLRDSKNKPIKAESPERKNNISVIVPVNNTKPNPFRKGQIRISPKK